MSSVPLYYSSGVTAAPADPAMQGGESLGPLCQHPPLTKKDDYNGRKSG